MKRSVTSKARVILRSLGCMAMVGTLTGCAGFMTEPGRQASEPNRAWAVVIGASQSEIAPGVTLELPAVPHKLWFADTEGRYFRASAPLKFRTTHGVVIPWEGGLYIRNQEPDRALVWLSPPVGQPTPLSSPPWQVKVRQFFQGP